MTRKHVGRMGIAAAALAIILAAGATGLAVYIQEEADAGSATKGTTAAKDTAALKRGKHVPEVERLLGGLKVEKPRTHKNMIVFPVRWSGKQAPGTWTTLDAAVAAGDLAVTEKDRETVPEVKMQNTGDRAVFLMSGEIVKGGKQTRVVRKDTVIEAKQTVAVAVFCVERSRWAGGRGFAVSSNTAPLAVQHRLKTGASQGEVWEEVRSNNATLGDSYGARSETDSLDETLETPEVQKKYDQVHEDLGKFSPPDTIGIAVADVRTGRVVGLELFGRRDLFDGLQEKLVEGYATDLVLKQTDWKPDEARRVTEDEVHGFITQALQGRSTYEDTPGSGRGLDLESGTLKGKGVAVGETAIHLSIQDVRPKPTPAKPIVEPRPAPPVRNGSQQAD
jgi:hypothetical protein